MQFIGLLPDERVILDLGCGTERDAVFMAEQRCQVTGVDLSPETLQQAKQATPDAKLIEMDIESLQLPEAHFTGIWANASLLHIPKSKLHFVLKDLFNLLTADGIIFYGSNKEEVKELLKNHVLIDKLSDTIRFFNNKNSAIFFKMLALRFSR